MLRWIQLEAWFLESSPASEWDERDRNCNYLLFYLETVQKSQNPGWSLDWPLGSSIPFHCLHRYPLPGNNRNKIRLAVLYERSAGSGPWLHPERTAALHRVPDLNDDDPGNDPLPRASVFHGRRVLRSNRAENWGQDRHFAALWISSNEIAKMIIKIDENEWVKFTGGFKGENRCLLGGGTGWEERVKIWLWVS